MEIYSKLNEEWKSSVSLFYMYDNNMKGKQKAGFDFPRIYIPTKSFLV